MRGAHCAVARDESSGSTVTDASLKALHVVSAITEEASGPSHTVPALCEALAGAGTDVTLHVLDWTGQKRSSPAYRTEHHELRPKFARRLGVSPAMRDALRADARRADVMHHHCLWMMPNQYAAQAVVGTRCRLVNSPRGVLSSWALGHSRVKKRLMWWLGQGEALRRSDCFHATADSEWKEIRALGFNAPVAVIPNGVSIPTATRRARSASGRKRILFLGRLHPKKGIDMLLRAWRSVAGSFEDWELTIVGPKSDDYATTVERMIIDLRIPRVELTGSLYGDAKQSMLASADLFVLPTHSENFGMAVAEALASGVPAIVSKGAPWSGLETEGCGWWIDIGVEPLEACLREALARSDASLLEMGARGRAWMVRDFSWDAVGQQMASVYAWLVGGGDVPAWVRLP